MTDQAAAAAKKTSTGAAGSPAAPTGGATPLADMLAPGYRDVRLHFPEERVVCTLGDVWRRARAIGRWAARRPGPGVGMVLTNTSSCATAVVGAIVHGLHLVSLPTPWRGCDPATYATLVSGACRQSGADVVLLDAGLLPLLPTTPGIEHHSYQEVLSTAGGPMPEPSGFTLTQFTSGSASDPRGVVLPEAAVAANVGAILRWLAPGPGDGSCSWLPLSHDMGLVGMFLAALAGGGPSWANGADVVLLTPEGFVRDPRCWLRACADYRTTITAAPNFGLEMSLRRPEVGLDLRALRVCITGAEPVRGDTLRRFHQAHRSDGWRTESFSPAYGLAECTLAVTGVPPGEPFRGRRVRTDRLAVGELCSDADGFEVVSTGPPLDGVEVRIEGGRSVGRIAVRGPSVADGYADGSPVADGTGWFSTGDLGWLEGDHLFVVGRDGDLFQVAGRNVHALDVERVVGGLPGIRDGRVAAVQPGPDRLVVVAEVDEAAIVDGDRGPLAERARLGVVRRLGVSPERVLLVARGQLPVTASGKPRRAALRRSLLEGMGEERPC